MRWGQAKPLAARLAAGLVALVLLAWAAGEVWVKSIGSTEADFMRDFAAERSHGLVELARAVTWLGCLWVLVPFGLVSCFLLLRAGFAAQAAALAVGLVGAVLIADLAKALVARPRPPVEHLERVSSSSFPSGHAVQASAFWLSLLLALRDAHLVRRSVIGASVAAILVIVAVAWSRVYLGVHYPSDVIAGVALGSAWAAYASHCIRSRV